MPFALFTLLRLHLRGKLRHSLRGLRTPRGLFFLLLGTLALSLWLGPALYRAYGCRAPTRRWCAPSLRSPFSAFA